MKKRRREYGKAPSLSNPNFVLPNQLFQSVCKTVHIQTSRNLLSFIFVAQGWKGRSFYTEFTYSLQSFHLVVITKPNDAVSHFYNMNQGDKIFTPLVLCSCWYNRRVCHKMTLSMQSHNLESISFHSYILILKS